MKKQFTKIQLFIALLLVLTVGKANAQCTNCSLTGLDIINTGQSLTYSVATLSGASYFWSVTGNLSISGSNTGSSVTITGGSAGTGKVCITRYKTSSTPCCSCKDVTVLSGEDVCDPFTPLLYASNMVSGFANSVCPGERFAVGIVGGLSGHTVQWAISPSIPASFGNINNNTATYLEFTDVSQYSQYTVFATFYCANGLISGNRTITINENPINCGGIPAIVQPEATKLYPNPVSKKLILEFPTSSLPYEVILLNSAGQVKYQVTTKKKDEKINVSGYKKGTYYIKIYRSDNWFEQLQFIKE